MTKLRCNYNEMEDLKSLQTLLNNKHGFYRALPEFSRPAASKSCLSEGRGSKRSVALASPTTRTRSTERIVNLWCCLCAPWMTDWWAFKDDATLEGEVDLQKYVSSIGCFFSKRRWHHHHQHGNHLHKPETWLNTGARPGLKADTPSRTCSLSESLPFRYGQPEERCQLKSIECNIPCFGLIIHSYLFFVVLGHQITQI